MQRNDGAGDGKKPGCDTAPVREASFLQEASPAARRESGPAPQGLLALQTTVGNAVVLRMIRQAGHGQAREECREGEGGGQDSAPPAVQRSAVHGVLRAPGRPLDDATRADMEARLGADFSDVRVHTDGAAKASAADVGARAYTSGNHVVVGEGGADKRTLAHELTHVLQQRQGPVAGTDNGAGLRVSDPSDSFEREAEANARRVTGGPAPRSSLPGTGPSPAPGGGGTASPPVQRVFGGALSGYDTATAMRELKEQFPGSKPKWSEVNAAYTGATAYSSLGDLAAALGLQPQEQQQQSGSTPAPAGVLAPATRPARTPPALRPKPPGLTAAGLGPATPAVRQQVPPAPTRATAPSAPVEEQEPVTEREKGTAEQKSVGDFKANSAQAREELAEERTTPRKYLRKRAGSWLDDEVFKQMAGSVTGFNKAKILERLIDQLYSCLEWTGRAPIAVFTHEAQGKGDLMLGVKTADALRENFPRTEANKNDITLLTAGSAFKKEPGVFQNSGHPFTVLDGAAPEAPSLDPDKAPTHAVVAPQLAATKNFQQSVGKWGSGSTVSAMTEYSKKERLPINAAGTNYTTGLGSDEVGITFNADLRAYKRRQDTIPDEKDKRADRLKDLQALKSPDLLTALFPEDQEQAAKAYAAAVTSRLYFAYSNKSAMRFALTVAELERDNDNDVHVVQSSPQLMPKLDEAAKRELANLGVARVRLVEVNSKNSSTTTEVEDTGGTGKTMHWITTNGVPHDDMLTLIKASEPIMMTTGNQSTSEALSAGKTILYESIGMQQSMDFRKSLYGTAGVKAQDIEAIAALSRDRDQRKAQPPGQPEFKAAAGALRTMEATDTMGAFSDRAAATKDLGRWIGGRHLRDYLMETELSTDLRKAEEQLSKEPGKSEAYRSFVEHLLKLPDSQ
ncbi:DUF4157 domain-containing protein [Streptomyces anulatus]|uniref:eCIS core domain-containing protein n=1 Tax=Streptomyces anulatus TaxID=1892 RepID=UPI0036A00625